jgi:transposase
VRIRWIGWAFRLSLWPAVSDIDGVTGMAIMRAIVEGERDARQLARLRNGRCHKSEDEIAEQLSGHWREDHIFSLGPALKMYDAIQERIAEYEREMSGEWRKWNARKIAGRRRRS